MRYLPLDFRLSQLRRYGASPLTMLRRRSNAHAAILKFRVLQFASGLMAVPTEIWGCYLSAQRLRSCGQFTDRQLQIRVVMM